MGSSIFRVGHSHSCSLACQSKIKNRMANNVDPDVTARSSRLIWIYIVCTGIFLAGPAERLCTLYAKLSVENSQKITLDISVELSLNLNEFSMSMR